MRIRRRLCGEEGVAAKPGGEHHSGDGYDPLAHDGSAVGRVEHPWVPSGNPLPRHKLRPGGISSAGERCEPPGEQSPAFDKAKIEAASLFGSKANPASTQISF